MWIGGPRNFRFIYYVHKETSSVLGIYITLEPRAKFSYDSDDWLENLKAIVADLQNEESEKFAELKTQEAVRSL